MTAPKPIKQTKQLDKLEDYYHHQLVCQFCGETWWGLHCPHDGYQNPCPNCDVPPIPIKGNCKCELVAPISKISDWIEREIIGDDDPTTKGSYYINSDAHVSRNNLRQEQRSKLHG